jgi:hypothetical protein
MNRRLALPHLTPGELLTIAAVVWLLYSTYSTLHDFGLF